MSFQAAVIQAAPVFLNREATIAKACDFLQEAARKGAKLALFPESFLPAYPDWVWAIPPGDGRQQRELYAELVENAVEVPGPALDPLREAARDLEITIVMGLTERDRDASGASLYNTLVYIDSSGSLLGKHRKLVPTGGERLVWAQGDGSTLEVYDTPLGKLGGLICWENYMPLARYTMYAQGTQIYAAATWDNGEPWLSTLRHIAKEGGTYVLGACMVLRVADIPERFAFRQRYLDAGQVWINPGDSAIIAPSGEIIAGPLHEAEGILYAEIDLHTTRGAKWLLDTAGHYARPDVFSFAVNREKRKMME
jgi:nitrilase